jgi:Phospholipase_D-nuclease N-terminal
MHIAYLISNLHGGELAILGLSLVLVVLWVWAVIDCALNEKDRKKKTIWLLFILLVGYVGAPVYFIRHLIKNEK